MQQFLGRALHGSSAQFGAGNFQPLQHHLHIAHGAVPGHGLQAVALQYRVQPMALVLRIELARQAHGAQGLDLERALHARQLVHHKAVVKAHVVGHEDGTFQQLQQRAGHVFKRRGLGHHGVTDASQGLDKRRYAHARVDQGAPARRLYPVLDPHRGDFGDAVVHRIAARGLQIKHHITGQHVGVQTQTSMWCMPNWPLLRSAKKCSSVTRVVRKASSSQGISLSRNSRTSMVSVPGSNWSLVSCAR